MNRQFIALVLVTLSSCCAVTGLFLSGILSGQAALIPLDEHQVLTMTATQASYYSPTTLKQVTGANIEQTETITGVGKSADSSVVIWSSYTTTWDTTRHQQLEPAARRLAIDRASAQLVNCCSANINGNGLIRQYGIAGYVFPPGTQPHSYDVFDAVVGTPVPVAYSGQDTVGGIPAYRFTEDVTAWPVGFSPQTLTNPELYSVHRVYWVDPQTGALLNVATDVDLYLAQTRLYPVEHLLKANLTTTPATVAQLVSRDARVRAQLATAHTIRMVLLWTAAVLAVIAAGLLARRRRTRPKAGDPGDGASAPGISEPGSSEPGISEPGSSEPGGSEPGSSGASGDRPDDGKPDDGKPDDGKPDDGKPDDDKPDDDKPDDYAPAGYRAWRLHASRGGST